MGVSRLGIYAKGSIVALVMGVPAVVSFLVSWKINGNLMIAIAISIVVYFISMGFAFKVAKRLASNDGKGKSS